MQCWYYRFLLLCFLICSPSLGLAQENLPKLVKKAIQNTKIPASAIGFNVVSIEGSSQGSFQLGWNASQALNPASTMKVLTTAAGLDILGPAYQWKTNLLTNGNVENETLFGDLIFQGFGDPKLVPEQMSEISSSLRNLGIKNIQGNLIFDRSAYSPSVRLSAPNDGESSRSYNVVPDALLYSFQTLSFHINPSSSTAEITYTPQLYGFRVINRITLTNAQCSDWSKDLKITITKINEGEWQAIFNGKLSKNCGEILWNTVAIDSNSFLKNGFLASWEDVNGRWSPSLQAVDGVTPSTAKLILSHHGTLLPDAIRDINKYSNNVMARQLFLTIGLEKNGSPSSTVESSRVIKDWLKKSGLNFPELIFENGSGLSNIERISPLNMTKLLTHIVRGKNADIIIQSLPIAGIDGTMKHRLLNIFKKIWSLSSNTAYFVPNKSLPESLQKTGAYIKTGTLQNVRAIAGYVVSKSGKVYAISSMINHPNAGMGGSAVNDALLSWVIDDCPND
jgi:serine-type D-Ala-D-Ala carboxypeptidase/endopeptidase (penicillin-binding protein 4)